MMVFLGRLWGVGAIGLNGDVRKQFFKFYDSGSGIAVFSEYYGHQGGCDFLNLKSGAI